MQREMSAVGTQSCVWRLQIVPDSSEADNCDECFTGCQMHEYK